MFKGKHKRKIMLYYYIDLDTLDKTNGDNFGRRRKPSTRQANVQFISSYLRTVSDENGYENLTWKPTIMNCTNPKLIHVPSCHIYLRRRVDEPKRARRYCG